ncbi:MAG TPA: hypothetical protein VKY92_27865 [Verrucomicrobiae bacterium]|nr:hypothetical protein [Verrucomicrobiae bacterium]
MRIWNGVVDVAILAVLSTTAMAQTPTIGRSIILTNGTLVRTNLPNPLAVQSVAPNLAPTNITPAIGPQDITPAINPQSVNPAIGQQNVTPAAPAPGLPGSTSGLGQQGIGIGQQGSGTAIGQQGSTAIGQQGVGTAILPTSPAASPGTNAIVIGQPEPFVAPSTTTQPAPNGFMANQNQFGQRTTPLSNSVAPSRVLPSGRQLAPTGRR